MCAFKLLNAYYKATRDKVVYGAMQNYTAGSCQNNAHLPKNPQKVSLDENLITPRCKIIKIFSLCRRWHYRGSLIWVPRAQKNHILKYFWGGILNQGPHKIGKVASLKSRRYYSSPNFETFFEAEQKMHEFTPPDRIIFKIWGMWLIAFHSSFYITVIAQKKVPRFPFNTVDYVDFFPGNGRPKFANFPGREFPG